MDRENSGKCIKVVERTLEGATSTIGELSPSIRAMEESCKNSVVPEETLFIIIANCKIYTMDGVNREIGYVGFDADNGCPFSARSAKDAMLFRKAELGWFVEANQDYLSSGYKIVQLNF